MLRCGQKRRRTHAEIEGEKEEERLRAETVEDKLVELEKLKAEHQKMLRNSENHKAASDILIELQSKKKIYIAESGNIYVPGVDEIQAEEV